MLVELPKMWRGVGALIETAPALRSASELPFRGHGSFKSDKNKFPVFPHCGGWSGGENTRIRHVADPVPTLPILQAPRIIGRLVSKLHPSRISQKLQHGRHPTEAANPGRSYRASHREHHRACAECHCRNCQDRQPRGRRSRAIGMAHVVGCSGHAFREPCGKNILHKNSYQRC